MRRTVRRIERRLGTPGNLRLVWRPAADVVGRFLTPGKVSRYHVYFPDPWPKKHHHRYRLLSPAFLTDLRDSLCEGGEVRFCTDHLEYGQETLNAFAEAVGWENCLPAPGYEILETRRPAHRLRDAVARGGPYDPPSAVQAEHVMAFLRIVLQCVALAIVYGIVHDVVTAHVCVEYFTIGHPTVIGCTSPVMLALTWGVLATWWVGLGLGLLLGLACLWAHIGSYLAGALGGSSLP